MSEQPPPVAGSGYESELERAMASGDEDALRDVVEKINAAVHEAAGSPPGSPSSPAAGSIGLGGALAQHAASTPPPAAVGLALSTPSLAGLESPPGVAMAIPAFPPSPMPRPNLTVDEARAEAAASNAARGLPPQLSTRDNMDGHDAGVAAGRAGTPRGGSQQADSALSGLGTDSPVQNSGENTPQSPPPLISRDLSGDCL